MFSVDIQLFVHKLLFSATMGPATRRWWWVFICYWCNK